QRAYEDGPDYDDGGDEVFCRLIVLLFEAALPEIQRRARAFEFIQLDPLRDDTRLFEGLDFFAGSRRSGWVSRFQAHFDHSQAQNLAGLQDRFADFLA